METKTAEEPKITTVEIPFSESEIAERLGAQIGSYLWNMWDGKPDDNPVQELYHKQFREWTNLLSYLKLPIKIIWTDDVNLSRNFPHSVEINGHEYDIFTPLRAKWERMHPAPDPDTNETQYGTWYAIEDDDEDNDWGYGSFDYQEAVRMLKERAESHPDARIAVIKTGPHDNTCESIITLDDLD